MNTVAILLATSLLGVDYELVTADSKEAVYVITIERELIDQLADGFTINYPQSWNVLIESSSTVITANIFLLVFSDHRDHCDLPSLMYGVIDLGSKIQ